jgi:hypothetical protein
VPPRNRRRAGQRRNAPHHPDAPQARGAKFAEPKQHLACAVSGRWCEIVYRADWLIGSYCASRRRSASNDDSASQRWRWEGDSNDPNEPDAEVWRRLFASLTGNSAVDAAVVREFCDTNGVTSAQIMDKIHSHRRINQQQEGARKPDGLRHGP